MNRFRRDAVMAGRDATYEVSTWPGVTAIWAMNEPLGASVLTAYPDTAFNGTINGPEMGIPSGIAGLGTGGEFDGLVDYCGNYSAALAAAFNPDLNWFISVQDVPAGEWATGMVRMIANFGANENNYISLHKVSANAVRAWARVGGVSKSITKTGITTLNPFFTGYQVNKPGVGLSFWMNNAQIGVPVAITDVWIGTLTSDWTGFGNFRSTSFNQGWKGPLYFAACGNGYDVSDLMIPFANKYGLTEAL